ncbi:MAG: OsmC family protein [Spirochaetes bacterium]|nr:OsmC family protein [Spirochaetota bacterium]
MRWKEKMQFEASNDANNAFAYIDISDPALEGEGKGQSPKQMFLQALAGCTGMDVIHILKKMRQPMPSEFWMEVNGQTTATDPKVFTRVSLSYFINGDVDAEKLLRAISMSQNTYCSIGAMIKKICPLSYEVYLNGIKIFSSS